MPNFFYNSQILNTLPQTIRPLLEHVLFNQSAVLYAEQVNELVMAWGIEQEFLADKLLPVAAACAVVPISGFYVGVIVEGASGNLYMGANMEFSGGFLGLSIHGEQAAINNAWLYGERGIKTLTVNAAPCGHCRQFLQELNSSDTLQVVIVHPDGSRRSAALQQYLPEAFGPGDLGVSGGLLTGQTVAMTIESDDELVALAAEAACHSYAPYSGSYAGIALETREGLRVAGRYAENAAYNPSLQPLASVLSQLRFQCLGKDVDIERIVMVEKSGRVDHMSHIAAMRSWLPNTRVELFRSA